jgi:acyl dehydratase/NAD(P)-dependent dehydrogenase (short-subunit alcohol dehydrogenase family)
MVMTDQSLASRVFTPADQQWFAALSGDSNPMHMDRIAARRTLAGVPVVHGIHTMLWALNTLAETHPELPKPTSLRASFDRFVSLGETVTVGVSRVDANRLRLSVTSASDGISVMTVAISLSVERLPEPSSGFPANGTPISVSEPLDLNMDEMVSLSGMVPYATDPSTIESAFKDASRWLGVARVADLAGCTRIVGMVCPGLHSIFHGLNVQLTQPQSGRAGVSFRVASADGRFRRLVLDVAGTGIQGNLTTTARQPPVVQPNIKDLADLVKRGEFANQTAMIIGGSRGLGELTAKLLAAGGARVVITYAQGVADAKRVVSEITDARALAEAIPHDATLPCANQPVASYAGLITNLYYFATPQIGGKSLDAIDLTRLPAFLQFYVYGFYDVSKILAREKLVVFYPSSVFVSECAPKFLAYAMAKCAGELLCAEMTRSWKGVKVLSSRLPRLPTDQTAGLATADFQSPVDVMLPLLRRAQALSG